jgi:hypothetical protein
VMSTKEQSTWHGTRICNFSKHSFVNVILDCQQIVGSWQQFLFSDASIAVIALTTTHIIHFQTFPLRLDAFLNAFGNAMIILKGFKIRLFAIQLQMFSAQIRVRIFRINHDESDRLKRKVQLNPAAFIDATKERGFGNVGYHRPHGKIGRVRVHTAGRIHPTMLWFVNVHAPSFRHGAASHTAGRSHPAMHGMEAAMHGPQWCIGIGPTVHLVWFVFLVQLGARVGSHEDVLHPFHAGTPG